MDEAPADFGHRSRHETAIMEIVALIQGIDYLHGNLRRFMRPTRRHVALPMRFGSARIEYQPPSRTHQYCRSKVSMIGVLGYEREFIHVATGGIRAAGRPRVRGRRAVPKPS